MSSFLELAQEVARDSGTVPGHQPVSVTGQSGRLAKIIAYTRDAWVHIQNHRPDWPWMRAGFTGTTLPGEAAYTAASWNIADAAAWLLEPDGISAYAQELGPDDEGPLAVLPWSVWRQRYGCGPAAMGRPVAVAVRPGDGALMLGPTPGRAYVIRGQYRRTPQVLAADGDVPALPIRYHALIRWRALMLLAEHDEAPYLADTAAAHYHALLDALERGLTADAAGAVPVLAMEMPA